jgi:hypothetical protein
VLTKQVQQNCQKFDEKLGVFAQNTASLYDNWIKPFKKRHYC